MNAAAPQVRENFARLTVDRPSHVAFGFRAQLVFHFLVVVHIHYLENIVSNKFALLQINRNRLFSFFSNKNHSKGFYREFFISLILISEIDFSRKMSKIKKSVTFDYIVKIISPRKIKKLPHSCLSAIPPVASRELLSASPSPCSESFVRFSSPP